MYIVHLGALIFMCTVNSVDHAYITKLIREIIAFSLNPRKVTTSRENPFIYSSIRFYTEEEEETHKPTQKKRNIDITNKMKILQITQGSFTSLGIGPHLLTREYPLNGNILIGFLLLISAMVCCFSFTFFEAKTFDEYTQSVYMGAATILYVFILAINIFNVENYCTIIDGLENIINTSECHSYFTILLTITLFDKCHENENYFFANIAKCPRLFVHFQQEFRLFFSV